MKRSILTLFLLLSALTLRAGILRDSAFPLLQRLNEEIVKYQCMDVNDPDYGGIYCPGENLYHTRAAEAVWPLTYEYVHTGNEARLESALILADWLFRYQQPEGQWLETPEEWTGTTTDQLLMLLLSYPYLEQHLSSVRKSTWLSGMEKAADYLERKMDNRFASINYCATTTATLSEAYLRFGKESYREKAGSLAHMITSKMNAEYFIEGEGGREGLFKYGVDLGYNMEMSLWGLAKYAVNLKDDAVLEDVLKSTRNHLYFIYPDGMLDASAGIRSNKWTVYGSGTSDGCHPLFALLSRYDPQFVGAAVRNIGFISKNFTRHGLLGFGPDYDNIWESAPCIYPTFTKAKSLAMAMDWVEDDPAAPVMLPCDMDDDRFFQSVGMAVVRRGPFRATVTAYDYKAKEGAASKYMHRPAGGSMTAFWVEGFGLLEASSQTEYHRWEPMSFPELPDVKPLTPRLEMTSESGFYTNLYDFDATVSYSSGEDVACRVMGSLKDKNQKHCGAAYTLEYDFCRDHVSKTYTVKRQTATEPIRIVEPIVFDENLVVEKESGSEIVLRRGGETVVVTCRGGEMRLAYDEAKDYRQVYPSLRALPLVVEVGSEPVKLTFAKGGFLRPKTPETYGYEWLTLGLAADPRTSMDLSWRTDASAPAACAQIVPAGVSPSFRYQAETVEVETTMFDDYGVVKNYHVAHFSGLEPSTKYLYRIGDGRKSWSEWFEFKTAGEESFSFVYIADVQEGIMDQYPRVIRSAYLKAPESSFVLFTGDLTGRAYDYQYCEFFKANGFMLSQKPMVAIPDNHEFHVDENKRRTHLTTVWNHIFPRPLTGVELLDKYGFHTFDYQGCRFILLNTRQLDDFSKEELAFVLDWVEGLLADNPCRWTVVAQHKPIYSSADQRTVCEEVQALKALYEKYNVDLVLSGHDHVYSRTTTKRGRAKGMPVAVTSMAGSQEYVPAYHKIHDVVGSDMQLFQVVEVGPKDIRYCSYDATGELYDSFRIRMKGSRKLFVDCVPDRPEHLDLPGGQRSKYTDERWAQIDSLMREYQNRNR